MRILLVEDEVRISTYVRKGLEDQGHAVDQAFTGREALEWAVIAPYDIVILDILLPEIDGIRVCRELRARRMNCPVLMLTARDSVEDRVTGLDSGADDYLVKPFALSELLARIRALSRRVDGRSRGSVLQLADLSLDPVKHEVMRGGKRIELTAKEFAILECMLREPDRVFTRSIISEQVWNYDAYNESNVVDVYIRRLRRKIDEGQSRTLIHTVRGTGYRLSADESNEDA